MFDRGMSEGMRLAYDVRSLRRWRTQLPIYLACRLLIHSPNNSSIKSLKSRSSINNSRLTDRYRSERTYVEICRYAGSLRFPILGGVASAPAAVVSDAAPSPTSPNRSANLFLATITTRVYDYPAGWVVAYVACRPTCVTVSAPTRWYSSHACWPRGSRKPATVVPSSTAR